VYATKVAIAAATTVIAFGAAAQGRAPLVTSPLSAADCAGATSLTGEVASVADGRSLRLTDGREVRLAAIETPPLTAEAEDDGRAEVAIAAKAALESFVLHHMVVLRPTGTGSDRYGRIVAFVSVVSTAAETLVQRDMLAGGHALLSPIGLVPGCRTYLRTAELAARTAKLGLWSEPYYVVRRADDPSDVMGDEGRFAVVGGRVLSVRESGGIVYVNFGRRWSEDFTVTILKRNERLFAGAGMPPKELTGRRVEVRGWVEARNGPAIEAARPEQIEFVDRGQNE
jgi:endonuclease YncB( thermonuclease family)